MSGLQRCDWCPFESMLRLRFGRVEAALEVPRSFGRADAASETISRRVWASLGSVLGVVLGVLWRSEGGLGRSWGLLGAVLSHLKAASQRLRQTLKRHRLVLAPSDVKIVLLKHRTAQIPGLVSQASFELRTNLSTCVAASARSGWIKNLQMNI